MKKLIFSFTWVSFLFACFLITGASLIRAEDPKDTTGTCNGGCNYSFGQKSDPKAFPNGAVICPAECPKCQTPVYSSSGYDTWEVCTKEDYVPEISDLGGEAFTVTEGKKVEVLPQNELAEKVTAIIRFAIPVAGLIAFILIVVGGFQIILSAGNPDRVKAGKEMIASALAGLFLIIFSIFILKFIGYDILNLPGFELSAPTGW